MTVPFTITRPDWEEPGWTVAEHTGSPPVDWSRIEGVTVHYPGSPNTWTRTPTRQQVIDAVRSGQRSYVNSRGYSYGYNVQVWGEHIAQVRGSEFMNAANGNTALNLPKISVQVKVPGQSDAALPATDAEIVGVQRVVAWAREQAGRHLIIDRHGDLKATPCPGGGLTEQVRAGVFEPPEPGGTVTAIPHRRIYDSRTFGQPVAAGNWVSINVPGWTNQPSGFFNVTPIAPTGEIFVSAAADLETSVANNGPGAPVANPNLMLCQISRGTITLWVGGQAGASTHLAVDHQGWAG